LSSKRDKFLESAQKFIIKGQFDRAIRDYEQAVALDPGDIRVRQRLAELLIRVKRHDEAISEYETIGKFFADNAFYLKAIAVYKQIQRLSPENTKITNLLAELNVKQGLTGNALAEFNQLVSHYVKSGSYSDALKVLERMREVDPGNLNILLKSAETFHAAHEHDHAYEQYLQLARQLLARPDKTPFARLSERVASLFPDRQPLLSAVVAGQIQQGESAAAIHMLKELISNDLTNLVAWNLMVDAVHSSGDRQLLKVILTKFNERFPAELRPCEELISLAIAGGDSQEAMSLLDRFRETLLADLRFETLEGFYSALANDCPYDPGPLEGLVWLYSETGNIIKLADANSRLAALGTGPETEPEAEELSWGSLEETALPDEPAEADLQPPDESPDLLLHQEEPPAETGEAEDWEEEIDLGLPEEPDLSAQQFEPLAEAETELAEELPAETGQPEPDRVTLIIENPLPIEAFLPPAEAPEEILTVQPDRTASGIEEMTGSVFDWSATDNRPPANAQFHAPELTPAREAPLFEAEQLFGDDELADFELLLSDDTAAAPQEEAAGKYGMDDLFAAFKKGVDEQLDSGDTESHYNLGIAYKEMGLLDDAVNEFRAASKDPRRLVDSAYLEGLCWREKGDTAAAEQVFRTALDLPLLSGEALLNLKYELANLFEFSDRIPDAVQLYQEIVRIDPAFRDSSSRLVSLGGSEPEDHELIDLEEES
jgi:pentatricopeptide repeat protein